MHDYFKKLKTIRDRINLRIALRAILQCFVVFVLGVHSYYLLWMNSPAGSQALLYSNVAIRVSLALVLIYLLYSAYQKFFSFGHTARFLDRQIDHQDDLFQNLTELSNSASSNSQANHDITELLAHQANKRMQESYYKLPHLLSAQQTLILISILFGIFSVWALNAREFQRAFKQFYTNRAEAIIYKQKLEISPGNARVGKNSQFTIQVLNPETRLSHRLFYRRDKAWRELALVDYRYTFQALDSSIEYYVEHDQAKSEVFKVEVLDEPYVKNWWLEYRYPAYTGLKPVADSLSYGNISAYAGTIVKLAISSNVPLRGAVMHFSDSRKLQLSALDERNFMGQLTINKEETWYLELTDELGRVSKPEEKNISILPDNPPQIKIEFPGQDVTLNQDLLLPLIITADDDFGLQNCTLRYLVSDREPSGISIQSLIPGKLFSRDYIFDLKELGLMPGAVVTYWAEIYDNSPAHQKAESTRFKARFPSIEEIYREIEQRESQKKSELEEVREKSKDLMKDFEQKRREILKDDKIDFQDKKELSSILENQEKLSQQVDKVAEDYQQLIEKMQANSTLSPETLQKMMKIQELMQEISNEDLQKAMEKFNRELQNLNSEALKKAMENLKFSMEDFAQKLDQTLQLLESIKKEQAVQKALQISEEMEKMQSALKEKSGNSKENSEQLASDQKNISDKYETLKEELDKLEKMLDPAKDKAALDQLKELQEQMKQEKLEQNLQDSQQQLSKGQRSEAQKSQQEAMQKMRKFSLKLGQMKNSMSSGSQGEMLKSTETAIRELLIFSKNHEATAARYSSDPYQIMNDLIANYDGIQLSLAKLYSNPMVTMIIPPKFFVDLTGAYTAYRELFVNVGEMQYTQMPQQLQSIQKNLNLMIYDLMQALQNQGQGSGSGSGMQSLMQQLEQMGSEQMAMNMLTQQLMQQMMQGNAGMSPAMQQQLQKLASDQQRLADNLKRALQNNPDAQKQGNSLQQIIDEAEAVSRQMRSGQINRETMERQERIVSRLLDAQRSINQREMSQKRKAESNTQLGWDRPASTLDFEAMRRKAMLDEGYRDYPKEYQQVILEYLKNVNKRAE